MPVRRASVQDGGQEADHRPQLPGLRGALAAGIAPAAIRMTAADTAVTAPASRAA
jgi:hypothetical protein